MVDLTTDNSTLIEKISMQITDGPLTEGLVFLADNLEGGMTAAFVSVLLLSIIFSGLLNKMLGAIRSL